MKNALEDFLGSVEGGLISPCLASGDDCFDQRYRFLNRQVLELRERFAGPAVFAEPVLLPFSCWLLALLVAFLACSLVLQIRAAIGDLAEFL